MSSTQTLTASSRQAAALLAALRESRADVERLFSSLSPQDLALPTICTGWSVRDELGHIIDATDTLARCLEEASTGLQEGTLRPKAMADAMQTAAIARAALLPLSQLQLTFSMAADRLLNLLDTRNPESWEAGVPHPYLGTCQAVQIAGMALVDWLIHPWDIRQALEQEPQLRPDYAALIIPGLLSLMPKRLDASRARNARVRFRYQIEKPGLSEVIVQQLDLVLSKNAATLERDAPQDVVAELTFRGQPGDLALALLGRRGLSRVVLPGPQNETWLSRWSNLWVSI